MASPGPEDLLARIHARCTPAPGGCLRWTGALSQSGKRSVFYPVASIDGKLWRLNRLVLLLTHREDHPPYAWETSAQWLARIADPWRRHEGAHLCDDALCLAPAHLQWQTHAANIGEQVARRRQIAAITRAGAHAGAGAGASAGAGAGAGATGAAAKGAAA